MKRVLVTGSSTGFGRELCTAFIERGWFVYATLRDARTRGRMFDAEGSAYPGAVRVLDLDVTNAAQRESAAAAVEAAGGLDCLINNAAYGQFGPCEETSEDDWRRQMEVNFFGPVLLTRRLMPALRASRGRVINISSILGLASFPLSAPYSASKFALEGWSESLHYELAPHGVQVALVEPGGFRTKFADNLRISPVPDGSPYAGQAAAYNRWREKRAARSGVPPEIVVRKIVALAERRRMPLRTLVGTDARLIDGLNRWLPRSVATNLLRRVYSKILS